VPDDIMKLLLGGNSRRRLLSDSNSTSSDGTLGWDIDFILISAAPLPASPNITVGNMTLDTTSKINAIVPGNQVDKLLNNTASLMNYVASYVPQTSTTRASVLRITPPPQAEVASASTSLVLIIGAAVGAVVGVAIVAGICYLIYTRMHAADIRAQIGLEKRQEDIPTSIVPASTAQAQSIFSPGLINIRISGFEHHVSDSI
jgi:hypothetical protein